MKWSELDLEENSIFLNGAHKGLRMKITDIKDIEHPTKESFEVSFEVFEGAYVGKSVKHRFWLHNKKAQSFLIPLVFATGLFVIDDEGHRKIPENFVPRKFIGHRVVIDTYIEEYEGREYTKVRNIRKLEAVTEDSSVTEFEGTASKPKDIASEPEPVENVPF